MSTYIGYSPNDFLYVNLGVDLPSNCNNIEPPSRTECARIVKKSSDPEKSLTTDEIETIDLCYKNELCDNKEKATQLINIQTNHLGSDGRYDDTEQLYWNEMVKTTNLIVGIGGLICLSFFVI